jgi:hypothetical protein
MFEYEELQLGAAYEIRHSNKSTIAMMSRHEERTFSNRLLSHYLFNLVLSAVGGV